MTEIGNRAARAFYFVTIIIVDLMALSVLDTSSFNFYDYIVSISDTVVDSFVCSLSINELVYMRKKINMHKIVARQLYTRMIVIIV